jgi:iron complex outermembrane recepter protein
MSIRAIFCASTAIAAIATASSAWAADWNTPVSFKIAPQALDNVLLAYSQQSGIQVVSASDDVLNKQSPGFRGVTKPAGALSALLKGTSLTFSRSGDSTVVIVPAATLRPVANVTVRQAPAAPLPPPEPTAEAGRLDEIVVTAQRRSESIQKVPISISVATGESLRQQNVSNLQDLSDRTPGLRITKGGAADQLNVRGTGSGFNPGFEQSVATFVDGIYHSRSRSARISFFDIERVEVLKGPQTTFFGANAIAGAINITTKTPVDVYEGNASALYSPSDGEYNVEAGVSAPIGEHLSLRLAGRVSGMSGYTTYDRLNREGPDLDDKQARIALRWTPTDRITINARYDIARMRDTGVLGVELLRCSPTSSPMGLCARSLGIGGRIDDQLDYHTGSAVPDRSNIDFDEAAVTAKLDFSAVTLVSTTGYLKQRADSLVDAAPYPVNSPIGLPTHLPTSTFDEFEQFSQELRLQSNGSGRLSYILGAYYEHSKLNTGAYLGYYFAPFGAFVAPEYSSTTPVAASLKLDQETDTWSAFGSISYEIVDRLILTGSLRYSSVQKDAYRIARMGTADLFASPGSFVPASPAAQRVLAAAVGTSIAPFPVASRTDEKLMPSANIRYEIGPDMMVYASYARGFKAGGFSASTNDVFRPELVDNYELGIKANWFSRRLTTNLTVFNADFSDLQETANIASASGALVSQVTNAAKSRTRGAEFSGSLRFGDFTLQSDLSYIDSHYMNYPNAPCTPLQTATGARCPRDLSGARRAYAPEWSGSVGANYRHGLHDDISMRVGGTVYFTSSFYRQSTISDLVLEDGYAKLDLRAAVGPDDQRWELAVIGKNVIDETTSAFGNYIPGAASSISAIADRPRSVAVQASVRW